MQTNIASSVCFNNPWLGSMQNLEEIHREANHEGFKAIKLLPNVEKFVVKVSGWDKLFALFGINKRIKAEIYLKPHNNTTLNRYISHQFNRMGKTAVNNPITCWRIGMRLVRKSNIFFVMALNHVFPKWHRNMKVSSVIQLALATRRIANSNESKLDFKRVYIEKSNGKWRPLGVPSPAWRIYLHMMNVVLTFYLEASRQLRDGQHGFRPGKGTLSAWRDILKNVIKSKDIYEFDLKGFFDSINLDYISYQLIKAKVPSNIVQLLYYINTCSCNVKPPYKLNEFEHMMKKLIHKGEFEEVIKHPRPLSYMYRVRGVPQGAPTSPILSLLGLHESIFDRNINTLMYADDGMYYGDISNTPLITPNSGMVTANVKFNHMKSGWVKKNGKWLKPLKFLGLVYDGNLDLLYADTRNGSDLKYNKEKLVEMHEEMRHLNDNSFESWKSNWRTKNSFQQLAEANLFGFIQSRLYQGSWDLDNYEQSFIMKYQKKSFMEMWERKGNRPLSVFTSTTFASEWLVKKLSTIKR